MEEIRKSKTMKREAATKQFIKPSVIESKKVIDSIKKPTNGKKKENPKKGVVGNK